MIIYNFSDVNYDERRKQKIFNQVRSIGLGESSFLLLEYSVEILSSTVLEYRHNPYKLKTVKTRLRSVLGILIKWTKHADYILSKYDQ